MGRRVTGEEVSQAAATDVRPVDASGIDILDSAAAGPAAIRGGILRVAAYGATVALSVVSAVLLIRHLGPRDFGRYTTVFSLVTVVTGLTEAGMTNVGVREFTMLEAEKRAPMLQHLLGLRLLITFLGTAAAVAFALVAGYDHAMVLGTAVAGAAVVIAIVQGTYTIPLQSTLRFGWVAAIDVLRQAVTVVAIAALVVAGASIVPLLGAAVIAALATLAATYALVRGRVPLVPKVDWSEFRRLLAVTAPYAVATAVGVIYAYVAIVLMSIVSTQRETGYFGASFRVFVVLGGLTGPLIASAFPILVRAAATDRNRLAYGLQRLWEIAVLTGGGLALVAAVGAPFAIDVVAGPDYGASVSVLRIQAIGLVATYVLATWGFALLSLGAYRALLVSNALALLTSAGITLAVAPDHGAVGTAFATLAGEALLAAAYGVALMRRRPDLRVKLDVVPKVALAVAVGCVPLLVPRLADAARLALAAVLYTVVLVGVRAVPPDVWHAVRAGIRHG